MSINNYALVPISSAAEVPALIQTLHHVFNIHVSCMYIYFGKVVVYLLVLTNNFRVYSLFSKDTKVT